MSQNSIDIRIRLKEAAKFAAETRAAKEEIKGIGDEAERTNRKSKNASGGLDRLGKSAKGLQGLFKPALIVAGIGLFAQLLTTASAGAVGLLGALAPVSGLLLALPAAFLGAAQGAGILKLGLSGVSGALGGLNGQIDPKKFAALSEPAQRFVLTLNSMKAPIRDLQRRVQNGLFPGLTKGLKDAMPALHALLGPLGRTGAVFGEIGAKLGHLVGSQRFSKDLADQANFNNIQLGRLGGAGIHVVDILRQLTVAARPLVSWLVKLAGGWAASADKSISAGRENGKLAAVFKLVQRTVGSVFKIVGNLGAAIFNVANLGRKHLGESLLGSLVKGSIALRKWTESGPGVSRITRFFEEAKPVVYAFATLLGAVVKDFLSFGTGGSGGLVAFMNKVRTEMLPELLTLSEGLIKIFSFISSNLPGGSWLLTIGYVLSKLGAGGLLSGIGRGLGQKLGASMGAGLLGEEAGFATIGTTLGLTLAGAIGAAVIGYGLGSLISKALPNGLLGNATPSGTHAANTIAGLGKGTEVRHGEIKPKRGFGHAEAGGLGKNRAPSVPVIRKTRIVKRHGVEYFLNPGENLPPGAERGGIIRKAGLVEVGERGPELVSLPTGAQVIPYMNAPTVATVSRSSTPGGWNTAPIHVHVHQKTYLDSKPIAEGTGEVIARHKALA
jgi:hypothetical protein